MKLKYQRTFNEYSILYGAIERLKMRVNTYLGSWRYLSNLNELKDYKLKVIINAATC